MAGQLRPRSSEASASPVASEAGRPAAPPRRSSWWRGGIGYQIYVRSFNDATGDGVGDLQGIRQRLPYIASLGVDLVWLTPFYPSPQADHGYDVADYTDVDPAYGTLEDFAALLNDAHASALKVIIDIVPNHTSHEHPWFRNALTGRSAARRSYYVWRDPAPGGGPPNNWVSKFGGPAWSYHPPTRQYYMHHFLPEQPDLNWAEPRVRDEFDRILEFWLDMGVDGFRIDTAHLLTEDAQFRDNPKLNEVPAGADPQAVYDSFAHVYDLDQPDVVDVYRRWHKLVARHNAVLLGEVALADAHLLERYVDRGALDLTFYFPALKAGWDARAIRESIAHGVHVAGEGFAWPLSSHDDPRAAERFGGGQLGARRALAYLTLLCGLPGTVFILQGDELGLDHGDLSIHHLQDPVSLRNPGASGRDGSRTPMPWDAGPNLGFSRNTPWLRHPRDRSAAQTVAAQERSGQSLLHRTRELFSTRRALTDLRGDAPLRWLTHDGPVIAYQRGQTVVALNTDNEEHGLSLNSHVEMRYTSVEGASIKKGQLRLPLNSAVIATGQSKTNCPDAAVSTLRSPRRGYRE